MCSALQEEELRKGGEPKYAHLAMELHVFIEVYAPIPEAYLRMAHAMEEVKKFLVPVSLNSGLVTPVYLMFAGFIGKKKHCPIKWIYHPTSLVICFSLVFRLIMLRTSTKSNIWNWATLMALRTKEAEAGEDHQAGGEEPLHLLCPCPGLWSSLAIMINDSNCHS